MSDSQESAAHLTTESSSADENTAGLSKGSLIASIIAGIAHLPVV